MTTNVKAFLTDVNRDGFHEVAEAILASGGKDAEHISYDNTESGLEAENVQAAVDEVAGDVGDLVTAVNGISGNVDDLETAVGGISDDVSDLQTAVSGKVSKSGDTMTGSLTIEDNLNVTGDINTQLVSTIGMQFVNALGGNIILTGHPTAAGSSTVEVRDQNGIMALTSDVAEKVSKSGDTMIGNLTIDTQNGTTSAEGYSYVILGNDKATGTDKNSTGMLELFGDTGNRVRLYALSPTATRYIGLPDKSGTVALTSDIQSKSYGALSTLPNITSDGLFGFTLTQNASVGGYTLPAGLRCFGYCSNNIAHCTGIANGTELYMLRSVGGVWSVLAVK